MPCLATTILFCRITSFAFCPSCAVLEETGLTVKEKILCVVERFYDPIQKSLRKRDEDLAGQKVRWVCFGHVNAEEK